MLTLVTGEPGNGKTAYIVSRLLEEAKERPLFVLGIAELKLDHEPVPPVSEWTQSVPLPEDPSIFENEFTFPDGALIVIDEAQKIFRPRGSSAKVPPYVQAFEKHRHKGLDFYLVTHARTLESINDGA